MKHILKFLNPWFILKIFRTKTKEDPPVAYLKGKASKEK
jgi:hypothetical protein